MAYTVADLEALLEKVNRHKGNIFFLPVAEMQKLVAGYLVALAKLAEKDRK